MNTQVPANAGKEVIGEQGNLFFQQRREGSERLNCEKSNIMVAPNYPTRVSPRTRDTNKKKQRAKPLQNAPEVTLGLGTEGWCLLMTHRRS